MVRAVFLLGLVSFFLFDRPAEARTLQFDFVFDTPVITVGTDLTFDMPMAPDGTWDASDAPAGVTCSIGLPYCSYDAGHVLNDFLTDSRTTIDSALPRWIQSAQDIAPATGSFTYTEFADGRREMTCTGLLHEALCYGADVAFKRSSNVGSGNREFELKGSGLPGESPFSMMTAATLSLDDVTHLDGNALRFRSDVVTASLGSWENTRWYGDGFGGHYDVLSMTVTEIVATPLPGAGAVMMAGLAGMGVMVWRRRSRL